MLNLKKLTDADRFLEIVSNSRGQVTLHLPDNTECDLKRDNTVRQLIRTMRPTQDGLWISLTDAGDVPAFLDFMTNSSR